MLIFDIVKVHRFFGNPQGWTTSFPFVSHDEVVATHVLAAFDPDIQGQQSFLPDLWITDQRI
jgi:hypothetical protein